MNQKIKERLSGVESIFQGLAKYNGEPAVFYQKIPQKDDHLWGTVIYPQIHFSLSLKESMKHEFQEGLKIQILCGMEGEQSPEDFESAVQETLDFCFFENSEKTFCTKWRKTSPTVLEEESQVYKKEVLFDVMIFQKQLNQEQNPVDTFHQWLKTIYTDIKIPGEDSLGRIWKKEANIPVVYSRLESIALGTYPDTWDTSWMMIGIRVHVIADYPEKNFYIKEISQKLTRAKQLKMKDGGPLVIHKIHYNDTMNPLKNRQFFIECQYGVLREEVPSEPIRSIQIQEGIYE